MEFREEDLYTILCPNHEQQKKYNCMYTVGPLPGIESATLTNSANESNWRAINYELLYIW